MKVRRQALLDDGFEFALPSEPLEVRGSWTVSGNDIGGNTHSNALVDGNDGLSCVVGSLGTNLPDRVGAQGVGNLRPRDPEGLTGRKNACLVVRIVEVQIDRRVFKYLCLDACRL